MHPAAISMADVKKLSYPGNSCFPAVSVYYVVATGVALWSIVPVFEAVHGKGNRLDHLCFISFQIIPK